LIRVIIVKFFFMVRPRLCRRIKIRPRAYYFKPRGIPLRQLEEVSISKEELEAVRLNDYLELNQTESARKMNTSQSTFQRILVSARKKISEALISGKALKIEDE
jgi:uncharacterized protein